MWHSEWTGTRETCSCSQTAAQWNQWRWSIHTYTYVGNTIQTINSPMYDTYMSTPGNTAKLGATHSNILTAQRARSVPGWKWTYNALVSIPLSQHSIHNASQAYRSARHEQNIFPYYIRFARSLENMLLSQIKCTRYRFRSFWGHRSSY